MKAFAQIVIGVFITCAAYGGAADKRLAEILSDAQRIDVLGRSRAESPRPVLFVSEHPKDVRRFAAYFHIIDPGPPTADGETIVLSCFCVDEYVVRFVLKDGSSVDLGLKHSFKYVVPSIPVVAGGVGNLELTRSSSSKLRRAVIAFERKPANKTPEPTRGLGLRFRSALLRSTWPRGSKSSAGAEPRVAHL